MHEEMIERARRRTRLAALAGLGLLVATLTSLFAPFAFPIVAVTGLFGGRWGLGWAAVASSLALAALIALIVAVIVFAAALHGAERRALAPLSAWPRPFEGQFVTTLHGPDVPERPYRTLQHALESVSLGAGLLAPKCAVIVDRAPNCLTIGRRPDRAWIVVTTGLLEVLSRDELEAVLAYELARITTLEVSVDTVVYASSARGIELWTAAFDELDEIALVLLPFAVLALPFVAASGMLRIWVLRLRARLADGLAVRYCRNPAALAAALRRIEAYPDTVRVSDSANAHLWLAYPHTRSSRWFLGSHRIMAGRIRRLERLTA